MNTYYPNHPEYNYLTKNGDSLKSIAYHFGITEESIKHYNPNVYEVLYPGQQLYIPSMKMSELNNDSFIKAMVGAERISVMNNAGFVMSFKIGFINTEGDTLFSDWSSRHYPINNNETCNLTTDTKEIPEGALVFPRVDAVLGLTRDAAKKVQYKKNNLTAVYSVKGITLSYSVELVQ